MITIFLKVGFKFGLNDSQIPVRISQMFPFKSYYNARFLFMFFKSNPYLPGGLLKIEAIGQKD